MSNKKIKFTSAIKTENHIEYVIQVDSISSREAWEFSHRYSYLRSIYNTLKKVAPSIPFPKKKIFGNKSLSFIEKRRIALEEYFSKVFMDSNAIKVLENLKFLKPEYKHLKSEETINCKEELKGMCKCCTNEKC